MNTLVFTNFDDYNWLKHNFNSSEFDQSKAQDILKSAMRFDQARKISLKTRGGQLIRMPHSDMFPVLEALDRIQRPDLYVISYALEKKGSQYFVPEKYPMHLCLINHLQNTRIYEAEIRDYFPDELMLADEYFSLIQSIKRQSLSQQDVWEKVFTFLIEKNCK